MFRIAASKILSPHSQVFLRNILARSGCSFQRCNSALKLSKRRSSTKFKGRRKTSTNSDPVHLPFVAHRSIYEGNLPQDFDWNRLMLELGHNKSFELKIIKTTIYLKATND